MGIRYNVIKVYPLFWRTKSKTIKIFELRNFRPRNTQCALRVQNRIQVQMHPWMLVETTRVTEFEYYFACTHKGVHLYSVRSPGKMIFAVLEL